MLPDNAPLLLLAESQYLDTKYNRNERMKVQASCLI